MTASINSLINHARIMMIMLMWVAGMSLCAAQPAHYSKILQQQEIDQSLEQIIQQLNISYLFPTKAEKAIAQLKAEIAQGKFAQEYTFERFKWEVESSLVGSTGDSNFEIKYKDPDIQSGELVPSNAPLSNKNALIESEVLEHNIGYLGLQGDFLFESSKHLIANEFQAMSGADALIIDLRAADYASIETIQYLLSFFYHPNQLLAEIHYNQTELKEYLYSMDVSPLQRIQPKQKIYLVHSSFVEGAWELFSYSLKENNRATIIGEETMGIGYLTKLVSVARNIDLRFANAEIKLPNSNSGWHQTGVVPDHQTTSEEALTFAISMAKEEQKFDEL